jgi:hypothetical protein
LLISGLLAGDVDPYFDEGISASFVLQPKGPTLRMLETPPALAGGMATPELRVVRRRKRPDWYY